MKGLQNQQDSTIPNGKIKEKLERQLMQKEKEIKDIKKQIELLEVEKYSLEQRIVEINFNILPDDTKQNECSEFIA